MFHQIQPFNSIKDYHAGKVFLFMTLLYKLSIPSRIIRIVKLNDNEYEIQFIFQFHQGLSFTAPYIIDQAGILFQFHQGLS